MAAAFLTSALDGGEWSASRRGHFIAGERHLYSLARRLGGHQSRVDAVKRNQMLTSSSSSLARQPFVSYSPPVLYTQNPYVLPHTFFPSQSWSSSFLASFWFSVQCYLNRSAVAGTCCVSSPKMYLNQMLTPGIKQRSSLYRHGSPDSRKI
jgi:hypothetical protein